MTSPSGLDIEPADIIAPSSPNGSPTSTFPEGEPPVNTVTAARVFVKSGKTYAPADFSEMALELIIDNAARKTTGSARMSFRVPKDGYPYCLLNAPVTSAVLNGQAVQVSSVTDPERRNTLVSVSKVVVAGAEHVLELNYSLGADQVGYREGGVGLVTAMADIASGNFFENYGPANFEDDQFRMSLRLSLRGVSSAHRVFTNAVLTNLGPVSWQLDFPEYFNSSSFYFHVTDKTFAVRELEYRGKDRVIPIVVYSEDVPSADSAASALPRLFSELEGTYGPFLHERFVAYISGSGGMEHAGATITSNSALGHELLHSWFGRGVMPNGGRSGWIDEAIASWRDYGYFRSTVSQTRAATLLDNQSVFDRFTPYEAYASGRTLMSELDTLFSATHRGLRPLLAEFFAAHKAMVIGTADLKGFLEDATRTDLTVLFQRYAYGAQAAMEQGPLESVTSAFSILEEVPFEGRGYHPAPLTREEIERLR